MNSLQKRATKTPLLLVSTLSLTTLIAHAVTVVDDFNDGDDNGWVRYDPISQAFAGAVNSDYSFPGGESYRIQGVPSPATNLAGAARAGAYRPESLETNFSVTVDLVDWDNSLLQGFGLIARASDLNVGALNGYALTYHNHEGQNHLALQKVTDEIIDNIDNGNAGSNFLNLDLDPANDYRLIFTGIGSSLSGEIFNLNASGVSLGTVEAIDSDFASGVAGVFNLGLDGGNVTDSTFDNFSSVPEPSSILLLSLAGLGLLRRQRK